MVWTSGETIIASRLIDIPSNKLIDGGVITDFNLLKIYSTNIFTETLAGTGDIVENLANGTLQATCPANDDDAYFLEIYKIALSLLPRIAVFKVNTIAVVGGSTEIFFGFSAQMPANNHRVWIKLTSGTWYFESGNTVTVQQTVITAPAAGDVFIIYATSGRCSLFKNGSHIATHTTNIPTNVIGHVAGIATASGQGTGSELTLGFMS